MPKMAKEVSERKEATMRAAAKEQQEQRLEKQAGEAFPGTVNGDARAPGAGGGAAPAGGGGDNDMGSTGGGGAGDGGGGREQDSVQISAQEFQAFIQEHASEVAGLTAEGAGDVFHKLAADVSKRRKIRAAPYQARG